MKSKSLILASILSITTTAFAAGHAGAPTAGAPASEKSGAHAGKHHDGGKSMTRNEVLAKASARFDLMDTNKDGVLTPEERKAGHAKMRAMHEKHMSDRAGMKAAPAK